MKFQRLLIPTISFTLTVIPFLIKYFYKQKIKKKSYYEAIFPRYEYHKCREHVNKRNKIKCNDLNCPRKFLDKILDFISSAKASVSICCNHITLQEVKEVLVKMHKQGIQVRIITDKEMLYATRSQNRSFGIVGIKVKIQKESSNTLHHKFCILDSQDISLAKIMFGSLNLTMHALCFNYECLVFTDDKYIVERFTDIFEDLWNSDNFKFL